MTFFPVTLFPVTFFRDFFFRDFFSVHLVQMLMPTVHQHLDKVPTCNIAHNNTSHLSSGERDGVMVE